MLMTKLSRLLPAARSRRRPADRRGVLLLVVLGMLAMFGLIGLAFVMMTGHARRGAEALRRKEFYAENHQKFAEEALLQVLRGTTNPASVLQNHSLLEDVYGNNAVEGEVSADPTAGSQLMDIQFTSTDLTNDLQRSAQIGHVLTFTSGDAAGESVRIVNYNSNTFRVVAPVNTPANTNHFIINGAAFSGTGFGYNIHAAANGPQLSMRMRSWTPSVSRTISLANLNNPPAASDPIVALLPNPAAFDKEDIYNTPEDPSNVQSYEDDPATLSNDFDYADLSGPGGANEDYDAPDYQNMLLALQMVDGDTPSPSLYRPALINYWNNQLDNLIDTTAMTPTQRAMVFCDPLRAFEEGVFVDAPNELPIVLNLTRRITLRPLSTYHPNFTGSNGRYWPLWDGVDTTAVDINFDGTADPIEIPEWDVDNDGDGIKDSVWVDLGLPVQTSKDGRRYKPLAAILCVDLDGRLNLNAHGNLTQASGAATGACGGIIAGGAAPTLDRGQGAGVAGVNLTDLLGGNYLDLLQGTSQITGRYGEDQTPGSDAIRTAQGVSASNSAPTNNPPYDFVGYPFDYFDEGGSGSLDFGSPVDLKGGIQVALDWRGQPTYQTIDYSSLNVIDLSTDTCEDALIAQPYELDLSVTGPRGENLTTPDAPFSPPELERLLRPYDIDTVNLPDRLERLVPGLVMDPSTNSYNNRKVTTESWDIPSVPCAVTVENLDDLYQALYTEFTNDGAVPVRFQRDPDNPDGILYRPSVKEWLDQFPAGLPQLLVVRLADGGMRITETTPADGMSIEKNLIDIGTDLLGPELMAGLPLNLNRKFTPRNSAYNIAQNNIERRAMARQLYCLAMLLADLAYLDDIAWQTFADVDPGNHQMYTARLLAQWAVNAVDFRCNDSIMTPFEYDQRPFVNAGSTLLTTMTISSGAPPTHEINAITWNVDGFLEGETYTFGGETVDVTVSSDDAVAHADRAVIWSAARPELLITETLAFHDRRTEDLADNGGRVANSNDTNRDFDQRWMPQGSLFVELYNPWSPNDDGVDLTATTATGNSPVWRLVTTTFDPANPQVDLDDPTIAPAIDRAVYFVQSASYPTGGAIQFYPEDGMQDEIAPILPGRYALIGPDDPAALKASDNNISGQAITYLGATPAAGTTNDRRIILEPSATPGGKQVWVHGDGSADDTDESTAVIQNATAIVINAPRRLNVTEPDTPYDTTDYTLDSGYSSIKDSPLDSSRPEWNSGLLLKDNNTVSGVYMVHLQRLANPNEPFDTNTNPYRTLDRMPIDVTSFNGVTNDQDKGAGSDVNETDGAHPNLFSRERGEKDLHQTDPVLWAQDTVDAIDDTPVNTQPNAPFTTAGTGFFTRDFSHSLGYLNGSYRVEDETPIDSSITELTGLTAAQKTDFDDQYKGSPNDPFPWLNWNNRPYLSKGELLMVPYASSSQLLRSFTIPGATESYEPTALTNAKFTHLPNFLNSPSLASGATDGVELHRILDYVRVPSRFVRTREPIMDLSTPFVDRETVRDLTDRREPGRVNLNTVYDSNIAGGLQSGLTEAELTQSRWGYFSGGVANALEDRETFYPTRCPNPFRSSNGLGLVPTGHLMLAVDREVNATLLRENSSHAPLLIEDTTDDYNNTDRNPYFRYLPLTRMGNTAGTRSNVYAVWVTIGYFEVEPVVYEDDGGVDKILLCALVDFPQYASEIYPDGVRLGREMGSDSGEVQRNRSFFMIDRSIPVGFQRGEDLNVKDTILIQREIE